MISTIMATTAYPIIRTTETFLSFLGVPLSRMDGPSEEFEGMVSGDAASE